ncbi:MAG TPA: HEAT repeat domain-containing protein [Bacteroidales bacterium]|nr:HEAT repeat domain-containing protein [Bacteroidales bacterium]
MKNDNAMECRDYRELITLKLCGELNAQQEDMLSEHIEECAECRMELDKALKMWDLLGEVHQEEPSIEMAERFNSALNNIGRKQQKVKRNNFARLLEKIAASVSSPLVPRLAFTVLILMGGFLLGYFLRPSGNHSLSYNRQIDSLSSQVSELKQMMMLSLLQDQSATMRLQAVSYTEELSSVDKQVIEALLLTLNNDPNVNVRLATLEALAQLADESSVREGLVRSIENQESPVVQSAIADVMVRLNEKRSVEPLKRLLSRKDINQSVKTNIELSIQKLI